MRIALWLMAGLAICLSFWFVYLALIILSAFEQQIYLLKSEQILLLVGMVILSVCLISACSPRYLGAHTCSIALLAIPAVVDARTGYVYNCFNYFILTAGMLLPGMVKEWSRLTGAEQGMLFFYLGIIIFSAAFHMIGEGDVPIYFTLMFYYMTFSDYPAGAVIFLLIGSQTFYLLWTLLSRKRKQPLIPFICLGHLVTLCVWSK